MKLNVKRKLLEEALNGLDNWIYTGWFTHYNGEWSEFEQVWKNPTHNAIDFSKVPEPKLKCHCQTNILNAFIIYRSETDEYALVGSECIKLFSQLRRLCVDCNKPNRCHTLRCKDCRNKCEYHNTYHVDNRVCQIMPFGKYRGKLIEEIIDDNRQYIEYLISKNILRDNLLEYCKNLLDCDCPVCGVCEDDC
jgi:uncharacterized protein (DUF3820 family)